MNGWSVETVPLAAGTVPRAAEIVRGRDGDTWVLCYRRVHHVRNDHVSILPTPADSIAVDNLNRAVGLASDERVLWRFDGDNVEVIAEGKALEIDGVEIGVMQPPPLATHDGVVFVGDLEPDRICSFGPAGGRVVAGSGEHGYCDGAAIRSQFDKIRDIEIYQGALWIVDQGNCCLRVLEDGQVRTAVGHRRPTMERTIDSSTFDWPRCLAAFGTRLWIGDGTSVRCWDGSRLETILPLHEPDDLRDGPVEEARVGSPVVSVCPLGPTTVLFVELVEPVIRVLRWSGARRVPV